MISTQPLLTLVVDTQKFILSRSYDCPVSDFEKRTLHILRDISAVHKKFTSEEDRRKTYSQKKIYLQIHAERLSNDLFVLARTMNPGNQFEEQLERMAYQLSFELSNLSFELDKID